MDLGPRLRRYERFFADPSPGQVLLCVNFTPDKWAPGTARAGMDLREYDFTTLAEHRRFWDAATEHVLGDSAAHEGIDDEWVPVVEPFYGYGSFTAPFADCELTFTVDTSYSEYVLDSIYALSDLRLDTDRYWRRVFVEAADHLSRHSQGRYFVNAFPQPSPLDLANSLRGSDFFEDLLEEPEQIETLLDLCTTAVKKYVQEVQQATAHPLPGSAAFGRWFPSGILLLEDAGDMISKRLYGQLAMPRTSEVLQEAGGGYLHHHSLGRHQYGNVAALNNLHVQQISSDPKQLRPATELGRLVTEAGHKVIDLEVTFEEIEEHIDEFQRGRFILSVNVDDKHQAKELVGFVRSHYPM